jgi:hypothetical protein
MDATGCAREIPGGEASQYRERRRLADGARREETAEERNGAERSWQIRAVRRTPKRILALVCRPARPVVDPGATQ